MDNATQARLNELLLQREELLLRIHQVETRVASLLGEPWPFERPPLPSDNKPRRKPGNPRAKSSAPGVATAADDAAFLRPGTLRALAGPADAWLVVYEQHGRRQEERHRDAKAIAGLLASQCATLRVLSIE